MGDDGQKLVSLPKNYLAMVETLLMEKKHEYKALAGWLGPKRFQGGGTHMLSTVSLDSWQPARPGLYGFNRQETSHAF